MANDFNGSQQLGVGDGSIEDAALNMPDDLGQIGNDRPPEQLRRTQPRDPASQQWRSPADEMEPPRNDKAKIAAELPPVEGEEEPAEDVSEVDDEFFEVEEERDGKKVPVRMKAAEVWQQAQEAKRLRSEMDDLRRNTIAPEQWDQALIQMAQARQNLMRELQMQRAMLNPQPPDERLLHEDSPNHNPQRWQQQLTAYRQQMERIRQIEADFQRHEEAQQQQQQVLQNARLERERAKTHALWPELAQKQEAERVFDELLRHYGKYGVNSDYIRQFDSAAFAIVKDALAYRRGQQAREAAVKVVRAKPKLVRASARDSQNPTNRRAAQSMQRLQQSGSIEDAANALEGLL